MANSAAPGWISALLFRPARLRNIVAIPYKDCESEEAEDERQLFEVELAKVTPLHSPPVAFNITPTHACTGYYIAAQDGAGLGLTVAGYICERESLCGIFVKRVLCPPAWSPTVASPVQVVPGSVADRQGQIRPNDQVIEVYLVQYS